MSLFPLQPRVKLLLPVTIHFSPDFCHQNHLWDVLYDQSQKLVSLET